MDLGQQQPMDEDALRQVLYQRLAQQAQQGSDRSLPLNLQDISNAQNAGIMKAAAGLGSYHGKVADTSPVSDTANAIAQQHQSMQGEADKQMGLNTKLFDYLNNKKIQQQQMAQNNEYKQGMLGVAKDKADTAGQLLDIKRQLAQNATQKTEEGTSGKSDKELNNRFTKFVTELNSGKASSRSDFGKQQSTASSADKIEQLAEQAKNQPGGLDSRQMEEVAISTANLLSQGNQGAQSVVQALVPKNYAQSAASIKEWLTSEPQGADQQKFVDRMLETARREGHLAKEKIRGYQSQVFQAYPDLEESDKYADAVKNLKAQHLGAQAQFDQYGGYKVQPFEDFINQKSPPSVGLTPAEQQRLQELRAKHKGM